MTVAKYVAPNYTDAAQTASIYKGYIDGGMSVLHAVAGDFAPHAQDTPDMTVRVDAGKIIKGDGTLIDQAAQNTATITAPVTNSRIDRVILNPATGAISVITGVESATPSAPSITAGYLPICQIAVEPSSVAITDSMITDERTAWQYIAIGGAAFDSTGVMTAGTVPPARRSLKGALVYTSAAISVASSASVALTFDSESYDTDGFHSTSVSTERFTIPAGVSYVRLWGLVSFASNTTNSRQIYLRKNGANLTIGPVAIIAVWTPVSGNATTREIASPPIAVSEGDYFTLVVLQDSGSSLDVSAAFAIEVVN